MNEEKNQIGDEQLKKATKIMQEQQRMLDKTIEQAEESRANQFREIENAGKFLEESIKRETELKVKPIVLLEQLTEQNEKLHTQNEKLSKLTKWLIFLTTVLVILTLILIYYASKTIN